MLLPDTISRLAFARAEKKIEPPPGANVPPPPPKPRTPPPTREIQIPRTSALSDLLKPGVGAEMEFKIKALPGVAGARG
jgi:hypothetical protein